MISAFLAGDALADHSCLWFGDGRITAGHLAVLRERAAAGPLELTLMDETMMADAGMPRSSQTRMVWSPSAAS